MTMTQYTNPGDYPRNFGSRVFERPNGEFFTLQNEGMNNPDRTEIPVDPTTFPATGTIVLDGYQRQVATINDQVEKKKIKKRANLR